MTQPVTPTGPVIVAAHGDDEPTRDAIALGVRLARLLGAPMLLAGVWDSPLGPESTHVDHAGRTELERVLRELAGELPAGVAVDVEVRGASSVVRGLHALLEHHLHALLVIGPSRLGAATRRLRGDVALSLMHDAPAPVAVAPEGLAHREDDDARDVVIAWDASPEALLALETAVALTAALDGTLRLVGVVELPGGGRAAAPDWHNAVERLVHERSEQAVAAVAGRVPYVVQVRHGHAAPEIAAAGEDAAFIVTGSRGHGGLRRLVVGSTTAGVLREAAVPVLVVPRGAAG